MCSDPIPSNVWLVLYHNFDLKDGWGWCPMISNKKSQLISISGCLNVGQLRFWGKCSEKSTGSLDIILRYTYIYINWNNNASLSVYPFVCHHFAKKHPRFGCKSMQIHHSPMVLSQFHSVLVKSFLMGHWFWSVNSWFKSLCFYGSRMNSCWFLFWVDQVRSWSKRSMGQIIKSHFAFVPFNPLSLNPSNPHVWKKMTIKSPAFGSLIHRKLDLWSFSQAHMENICFSRFSTEDLETTSDESIIKVRCDDAWIHAGLVPKIHMMYNYMILYMYLYILYICMCIY